MKKSNLKAFISDRIRTLRIQKGITQEELENIADLPQKYVYKLERQQPNIKIDTLEKVLAALDCDLADFFDLSYTIDESELKELLMIINEFPNRRRSEIINLLILLLKEMN
ncbi:TPA: helix-turn-helix domain-containing protein [Streptococcus suis]